MHGKDLWPILNVSDVPAGIGRFEQPGWQGVLECLLRHRDGHYFRISGLAT
ncbi:MAG: hypothetical protein ACR2GY_00030 [Phycisphaerales bacterium]